eukprot:3290411-Prymnesium_polylepis.1
MRDAALLERFSEASAELLAAHSPPRWAVRREQLGSCGRSVRAGQRTSNVTRRRSTDSPSPQDHRGPEQIN